MADAANASIPVLIAGGAVALTTGAGVMAAAKAKGESKDEQSDLEAGTEASWSRETNVGARFRRDVGLTGEIRRWKIARAKIKYMPPQVRTSAGTSAHHPPPTSGTSAHHSPPTSPLPHALPSRHPLLHSHPLLHPHSFPIQAIHVLMTIVPVLATMLYKLWGNRDSAFDS